MNKEHLLIQQYIPVSPRNTVMYVTANSKNGLDHTVIKCLKQVTTLDEIATEVNDPPS